MWWDFIKLIVLFTIFYQTQMEVTTNSPRQRRLYASKKANWTKFNFVVAIIVNSNKMWRSHCTGSLIAPNKVLTAAHCFFSRRGSKTFIAEDRFVKVIAGEHYWLRNSKKTFNTDVDLIKIHEKYTSAQSDSDIAVLVLSNYVPVNGKDFGVVSYGATAPKPWTLCEAAGWGLFYKHFLPKELQSGIFMLLPGRMCREDLGIMSDNFLCSISPEHSSVCSGDSGGPLICNGMLSGIIDSSGINCTEPNLFTNVANFKEWIDTSSAFTFFKMSASFLHFFLVYVLYIW